MRLDDPRTGARTALASTDDALLLLGEILDRLDHLRASGWQLRALREVCERIECIADLLTDERRKQP